MERKRFCICGNRSLAELTDHSCDLCWEDYQYCPKCLAKQETDRWEDEGGR